MKIGFFDSGLGGLIVLRAVRNHMPKYDYVFFGDTANVPYGDKTEDEIYELTKKGIVKLFEAEASIVIVACNTASSESLRRLQDSFLKEEHPDKKVIGVIIPTVETVSELGVKRPLLIATRRTVDSNKYSIELNKVNSSIKLISVPVPGLVPLIEENELDEAYGEMKEIIDRAVGEIDAVILGCTHYSVLKDKLRDGYQIPIISQDEIIPKKLKLYLEKHKEIERDLSKGGSVEIVLSKESEHYNNLKKSLS